METVNRLTDVLVTMNTPADRGKLFKIIKMLYGLWACPFPRKPSLWTQTPPFWNTSFFPLRQTLAKSYKTHSRRSRITHRTGGVSHFPQGRTGTPLFYALCYAVGMKKPLIYAALRTRFSADKGLIPKPSKSRFYCVTGMQQGVMKLWQFSEWSATRLYGYEQPPLTQ